MVSTVSARLTAVEWDFRTELAATCCQEAFCHIEGSNALEDDIVGFQQPVNLTRDGIDALSRYDILAHGARWTRSVIAESLSDADFARVSKAIVSSHFGNGDLLLRSTIDAATSFAWGDEVELHRTVLRDMVIYTHRDADAYLQALHSKPRRFEEQKALGFPGFAVAVLPPTASHHERVSQQMLLQKATSLVRRLPLALVGELEAPRFIYTRKD